MALIAAAAALCMLFAACAGVPASEESASASAGASGRADAKETTAEVSSDRSAAETGAGEDALDALEPRALVAYFSATGRTKEAAEGIAEAIHAELFQIVPAEPYTADDLDYGDEDSRTTREVSEDARPAIESEPRNIRQYDVVYLGYPIWWGEAPPIIRTFLDENDLSGMKVVPFCTSGSTGIAGSEAALKSEYPDIDWQEGMRIADPSQELTMSEWSDELGFWPFGE